VSHLHVTHKSTCPASWYLPVPSQVVLQDYDNVEQVVEALCYSPKGRAFFSRLVHWIVLNLPKPSNHSIGFVVDSASSTNVCPEFFGAGGGGGSAAGV
jgi:hypothetical protein